MIHTKYTYLLIVMASACTSAGTEDDATAIAQQLDEPIPQVETFVAHETDFYGEIVSNGKAVADRFADVYWEVDGQIAEVGVKNGATVVAGQRLASVEAFRLTRAMESAKASMENSRLSMYEVLIGQGYSPDSANIPEKVRELAEIKSGFRQAQGAYRSAEYDLQHATLTAPIGGIVANITERPSNRAQRSQPFCRIIDPRSLCVEFTVIENELPLLREGNEVLVRAFSMPEREMTGRITEVNPYVEKNGMVKVKAHIDDSNGVYEGMNLSVKVRRKLTRHIVVPKTAVVMRSGKPVVFVAQGHQAQWRYVETGDENSEGIAILTGVNAGDSVIVSGNTSLAHESKVTY